MRRPDEVGKTFLPLPADRGNSEYSAVLCVDVMTTVVENKVGYLARHEGIGPHGGGPGAAWIATPEESSSRAVTLNSVAELW